MMLILELNSSGIKVHTKSQVDVISPPPFGTTTTRVSRMALALRFHGMEEVIDLRGRIWGGRT